MTTQNEAILWYTQEFTKDPLYLEMVNTVEGSPWHREQNVGVHTNMVVMEYVRGVDTKNEQQNLYVDACKNHQWLLGFFACVFHDVGKPSAEQEKFKESRGVYHSYNGHEQLSARMWEDWAVKNMNLLHTRFGFARRDIYRVSVLIEYHKPWDIKKRHKLERIFVTLLKEDILDAFVRLVTADTWGRISDDYVENRVRVIEWLDNFTKQDDDEKYPHNSVFFDPDDSHLHVLIGPSGVGKTTHTLKYVDDADVFSLDIIRMEKYSPNTDDSKYNYAEAFNGSTNDKDFKSSANNIYKQMLDSARESNRDLVLDNTNTTKKSRQFYIDEARRRGFIIVGVLFPITLDTVIERQKTRPDKNVPTKVVIEQYNRVQMPLVGEMDDVLLSDIPVSDIDSTPVTKSIHESYMKTS